ncbi:MAG: ATP-binding protein [Oscillospiraceae bacterium]|jgi:anti-sigma regulatory factor (Ser/Thr protein kinase)|nr:ATP-binding protein [Oscillospiraceae bacterium]
MKQITIPAKIESLQEVFNFISSEMSVKEAGLEQFGTIKLAVEEIFANIVLYAYHPEEGEVKIFVAVDSEQIIIKFADRGVPFDPLAIPDHDITLSADERKIGGLGVFMVKKFMSNVEYRHENGYNILTISKDLGEGKN